MYGYGIILLSVVYFIYFIYKNYYKSVKIEQLILEKKQKEKLENLKIRDEIQQMSQSIKDIKSCINQYNKIDELQQDMSAIKKIIQELKLSVEKNTEELSFAIEDLCTETSNIDQKIKFYINLRNESYNSGKEGYMEFISAGALEREWIN